jgi:5-methylcytosine-specific restriction endonuclease McrA
MPAIPKPVSRAAEKQDARKLKDAYRRVIYRLVSKRDQHRCRVCGTRHDVEIHHIRFRSVGGKDATQNLACLCKVHHQEVHAYRLAIEGNADGLLKMTRFR